MAFIDWLERIWRRTGGALEGGTEAAPPGTLAFFAGSTVPSGWLECNGQPVSRETFSALFVAIGTIWGAGDGSTTFNLPDFRGRSPVGRGTGPGLSSRSVADSGGAETHALTTAELATHTHALTDTGHTHTVTDAGHAHGATGNFVNDSAGTEYDNTNGDKGTTQAATASATTGVTVDSATTGIAVSNEGSGDAHENMQPFAVVTSMIKT
ncbi:MAG: phage tail protein [Geminicoccaceae bacterium]